ncbi:oxidoreductase,short chain dehydrogenase [Aspergillus eucalypticola CBS 122712]|uniref:Oxidoreductase,short chain dehydrogenase n=1 Tax=Aspergillus eucalypticola (strain CBS 122712 / IBT 29274) TaxID=1448314 RepID=A0A317VTN5_ASPEC|nr:oxidoreductase,short chain dehydrogenase [Aspergillus eucalypticola CBS 122712]PWY76929.1 oxidoreductase,short chain dehydrogenase [Aspergillus eucalypticola CBS 122712]
MFDVEGKYVLVAGGSKGLGRELSLSLVKRGAHVTAIARSENDLNKLKVDMDAVRVHEGQVLSIQRLDLTNSDEVTGFMNGFEKRINALFCIAGGAGEEVGHFVDISATSIQSCMERNYLTAAFISQAVMKIWATELKLGNEHTEVQQPRHLVFTGSTAAIVAVPGYAAYSPSKAAVRSLADSLRQESLMYSPAGSIQVHCSFPKIFMTERINVQQARKPQICKEIDGTAEKFGGLTVEDVARQILAGLDKGCYMIPTDLQTRFLLNNMRGPSPRDNSLVDWLLSWAALLIYPVVATIVDWKVMRYGRQRRD